MNFKLGINMDEYLIVVDQPLLVSVGGNYFYAEKSYVKDDKTYYKVIGGCDDTHLWCGGKDYGAIDLIIVYKDGNSAGAIERANRFIHLGKATVKRR